MFEKEAEEYSMEFTKEDELLERIAELEAQIEKMKCCYNCKHSRTDYVHCITDKSEGAQCEKREALKLGLEIMQYKEIGGKI